MLQKIKVNKNFFFLKSSIKIFQKIPFSFKNKTYIYIYDKICYQKIVLQLPSNFFIFVISKKCFILYSYLNYKKEITIFYQKISNFFSKSCFFFQNSFVFKVFIKGIGFKIETLKNFVKVFIGFSHCIYIYLPNISVKQIDSQSFFLSSKNKQLLGEFSARFVRLKNPDPYKNKGIFFTNLSREKIIKNVVFKVNFQKKNK